MTSALVVGFDLDMTLVDSRPGIAAAYRALTEQTGVYVDADLAVSRLGPPLRTELLHWFPPERIEEAVTAYRSLYTRYAIEPTLPLPGALDALAAIRARGGRVVVITSKVEWLARTHLEYLDIPADDVVGDRFADGKRAAIVECGVSVYVGDHVADMAAARAAGVLGVGVSTGPCSADELREAGATVVLSGLSGLPAWLDRS